MIERRYLIVIVGSESSGYWAHTPDVPAPDSRALRPDSDVHRCRGVARPMTLWDANTSPRSPTGHLTPHPAGPRR
jgi:hypothetical protein